MEGDGGPDASKAFIAASNWLSSNPGAANLPNEVKLELYGVFKFVKTGAGPDGARPSFFSPTPRAKYDAWAAQFTKYSVTPAPQRKTQAQERYITLAKNAGWDGQIPQEDNDSVDLERLSEEDETERRRLMDVKQNNGKGKGKGPEQGMWTRVSMMSPEDPGDEGERDAIHQAVIDEDEAEIRGLIQVDPGNLNAKDNLGSTPLHLAVDRGHLEIVKLLLRLGADKGAVDEDGQTPLMIAELLDREDLISMLR